MPLPSLARGFFISGIFGGAYGLKLVEGAAADYGAAGGAGIFKIALNKRGSVGRLDRGRLTQVIELCGVYQCPVKAVIRI